MPTITTNEGTQMSMTKTMLRALATALAILALSPNPSAFAQTSPGAPASVLSTGGGAAPLDTSDSVLL